MCKDGHDARALSKSQRAEWYSQGATYGYCDELLERVKPTDSSDIPRNGYVYMSPHQDDEALFYGAEIMDKTRRGIPVTVVLMGLGDKAPGCRTLGLKGEACTKQRDREFTTSVRRMHATPVILKTRFHDVEARATEIAKLMKPWVDAGNEMHTLTQYDSHPDHSNLGFGLADNHGTKSHWHVKNTDELATKPVPFFFCWQRSGVSEFDYTGDTSWQRVLKAYTDPGRVGGYSNTYFDAIKKRGVYWSREYQKPLQKTPDGAAAGCSSKNWWLNGPRTTWFTTK